MDALVLTDDQQAICAQAETWPERARSIQITSDLDYAEAGAMLKGVKALLKEAGDVFDPAIRKAHEAHKAILAAKNDVTAPLLEAEKILKRGMAGYTEERERLRLEEQRRLQIEADRLAAEERKHLEAERAREISEAADKGAAEFLEALAKPEPVQVAAPVVEIRPSVVKMAGISTRKVWKPEVTDLVALLRYIADNAAERPALLSWVTVNTGALRELAHADGETGVPGVRFVCETVVASR